MQSKKIEMISETKEKRSNLLVVRLTDTEMNLVRKFKQSNRQINISFIVRQHLLKVIDSVALRDKVMNDLKEVAALPLMPSEAFGEISQN